MDITYRNFDKDQDYEKQRKLFLLSFPETIATSVEKDEHYHWKFEKFPHEVTSYQYVASEPQELVGYYAALPYKYQIGKKEHICGMVCDVMTHPDRRGKGIFTQIGHFSTNEMHKEKLSFTTGYPIRPEVIPGHIKVGWKIVLQMPMYLRLCGVKTFLPKQIRFISALVNPFINLVQLWTHFRVKDYHVETFTKEEFFNTQTQAYKFFLKEWLGEQNNALVKSIDFLDWRTSAPQSIYYFIILKKDNHIIGISIARPTTLKGVEVLAILDFMVLKKHFKASKAIHSALWVLAKKYRKDAIVSMTTSQWAKNYGFFHSLYVKTPAIFSLIIKKLSKNISDNDLFNKEKWHLFWIDSDDV